MSCARQLLDILSIITKKNHEKTYFDKKDKIV